MDLMNSMDSMDSMTMVSDPSTLDTTASATTFASAFGRDLLEVLRDIATLEASLLATCARGIEQVTDHALRSKLATIKADVERQLGDVVRCTTALAPSPSPPRPALRRGRVDLVGLGPPHDEAVLRDARAACHASMQAYERLYDQFRGYGFAPLRVLIRRGLQARREQWGWCSRRVI